MEVTKEQLLKRLNSNNNLINKLKPVETIPNENIAIIREVPASLTPKIKSTELRVVAGTLANFDSVDNVAESLGMTSQQVRSARDSTSPPIKESIATTVEKVSEIALTKLMDTLGLLSVESISNEKPKDQSIIAANLSRVYGNIRKKDDSGANQIVFHIHSPELRNLRNYEVVNAR